MTSGNDAEPGIVPDGRPEPSTQGRELGIVCTRQHENRHRQFRQTTPQRLLGSCPDRTKAGRQPFGPIEQTLGPRRGHVIERSEQRIRQPCIEEPIQANAQQTVGETVISDTTLRSFLLVVDPGRGADENKRFDPTRVVQGQMQQGPSTHRIAHVDGCPAHVADEARRSVEVGVVMARFAVARRIDEHQFVIDRQIEAQAAPAPAVLGEAVRQHDTSIPRSENPMVKAMLVHLSSMPRRQHPTARHIAPRRP